MHLPLQSMENSMTKPFSFHLKPSLLNNAFHTAILACSKHLALRNCKAISLGTSTDFDIKPLLDLDIKKNV